MADNFSITSTGTYSYKFTYLLAGDCRLPLIFSASRRSNCPLVHVCERPCPQRSRAGIFDPSTDPSFRIALHAAV